MSGASREEVLAYLEVMSKHLDNGGDLEDLPRPENIEVLPEIIATAARMAGLILDYIKTGEAPDMAGMPSPESQLQVTENIDIFEAQGEAAVREQMTRHFTGEP